MEKFFLFNKIDRYIIHPITLKFIDKEFFSLYIDKVFSYKYYISFSIFELLLSIIAIIFSINSYYNQQSILNNLRLFIILLLTMFLLINIVFFRAAKDSIIYKKVLIWFGTTVHIFSYKLLLYILLSITYFSNYLLYEIFGPLCSLMEMFLAISYIHFINDTFLIHICSHFLSCFLIFIIETFLNKYIQFSYIFLISFISSILICIVSYFHEKFQKIEWFLNYRRVKDIEYYAKMFLNNTFILVSFNKDEVISFNPSIRYIIEKSALKEDFEKLLFSKSENENDFLNENPKAYMNEGLSIIIKKLIFSKIKVRNENISKIIKQQIDNLESNEKNFLEKINTFFAIIRDNPEEFTNIHYIGVINFENIDNQYSVFVQVNQFNEQINYFAVALDFPIEVSQNIEILSKISILNSKITHEIKNPLAAIQTLVSEIKTFIDNIGINEVINKLDAIFDYSECMKYITKDFEFLALKLNNLRDQGNITEVDIKKVNFPQAVNFAVELIKNIWKNKNSRVLIKKEIDKEIEEYINTDEIRVKQIIINLLSNSLKFTKMRSVTLVCSNFNKDYILIMVKDTGIGMKEEQIEKLNEEGTLFLKNNNNNQFGSGLGLSVVKDMVKILGKDFKVESKYNEGSKISFLLNKNIDLNKSKEINETVLKTESNNKRNIIIVNNEISSGTLTGYIDSNMNFNNNTKYERNSIKNQEEEMTKRENFVLIKPKENNNNNQTLQTTIAFSNCLGSNLHLNKYYDNSKRRSSSNIFNKSRMSMFINPQNIQIPRIKKKETINEVFERNMSNKQKIYALVVEDEQVLRNCNVNLITKFFHKRGINVFIDECNDGIECIYKIYKGFVKEIKYKFIVTDEQMNIMNGNMMTNVIRSLIDEKRFYPIKIYSSSGNNLVDENFKKNYERLFSKPLTVDNVIDIFKDNIELEEF